MKIAILLDEDNFRRYAAAEKLPEDFELRFFGNKEPDETAIAAFSPEVIVADPMTPVRELCQTRTRPKRLKLLIIRERSRFGA